MNNVAQQRPNAEAYIQTPIGLLKFYTTSIGGVTEQLNISQCQIEPSLPDGMNVNCCIVVLLQFWVAKPVQEFSFYCVWETLKTIGHGNSGEALDAWEWENDNYLVTIGTEDAESLNSRTPNSSPDNYISMRENKIRICLKELQHNKLYSLHYAISWNTLPESPADSCWFAVDIPHLVIRKFLANSSCEL
jgi:hypothetical protein